MGKYDGEVISLVIVFSGQSHDLSIWARPGGCLPSPYMCLHEHASCKTIVFQLAHKACANSWFLCVHVCEIFRLSVLSGEVSVPRHFIQHRIHSQRIVSGMWCLGFQKALDALFFFSNSHSIGLAWLTSQLSTLFTCKIKRSQPQPSSLSLSCAFVGIKFFLSGFLLGLHQRCPRRLTHNCFWKQVSLLFLLTSPVFLLYGK